MHAKTLIAGSLLSVGLVAAQSTDAPVTTDNPVGPVYVATLPEKDSTTVRGSISASAGTDGEGVVFAISFSGLDQDDGPYSYHIHQKPVPADGNCTATGGHVDPYGRTDTPPCDADKPESCEVGDLSGKHGKLDQESFSGSYTDLYVSTKEDSEAFVGDRSIVVHNADGDRVTCASFKLQGNKPPVSTGGPGRPSGTGALPTKTMSATGGPSPGPSGGPPASPSQSAPVNAAVPSGVFSVGGVMAALVALVW